MNYVCSQVRGDVQKQEQVCIIEITKNEAYKQIQGQMDLESILEDMFATNQLLFHLSLK